MTCPQLSTQFLVTFIVLSIVFASVLFGGISVMCEGNPPTSDGFTFKDDLAEFNTDALDAHVEDVKEWHAMEQTNFEEAAAAENASTGTGWEQFEEANAKTNTKIDNLENQYNEHVADGSADLTQSADVREIREALIAENQKYEDTLQFSNQGDLDNHVSGGKTIAITGGALLGGTLLAGGSYIVNKNKEKAKFEKDYEEATKDSSAMNRFIETHTKPEFEKYGKTYPRLRPRQLAEATPPSALPSVFSLVTLLCLVFLVLAAACISHHVLLCDDEKFEIDEYPIHPALGYCPTLAGDIV